VYRAHPRRSRAERKADAGDPQALAAEFGRVLQTEEDVLGTALTLAPAQWQPVAGTGFAYSVPVARIPLAAVDMWWALNPEEIAAPERKTSWAIGGLLPIPGSGT
jgi:hypothetical protein